MEEEDKSVLILWEEKEEVAEEEKSVLILWEEEERHLLAQLLRSPLNRFEFHVIDVIFTDGAERNTIRQIHSQYMFLAFGMVLRGKIQG